MSNSRLGRSKAQQARVDTAEEQRDAQTIRRELVSVAPHNDPVKAEPAQIVSRALDGIIGWINTQQSRGQDAHFLIGEPSHLESEYDQNSEQRLHALVAQTQRRSPLSCNSMGRTT